MEETKSSPITNALFRNDGIFNYATSIIKMNLGNQTPVISDADYSDFKQFLKVQKILFDTETELALKTLWL
jgi:carboxyl-terminal processing protease